MDRFTLSVTPPLMEKPPLRFIFQGVRLVVEDTGAGVRLPDVSPSIISAAGERYIGTLSGRPCLISEIPPEEALPGGAAARGLRGLYERMDEDIFGVAGIALQIVEWNRIHRFCGRCGNPTKDKTDELAKICPDCGLINHPRISPAVITAVTRDNHDQILLARAPHFKDAMYSVIAGYVELGETLEACVRREIFEETRIRVKNIRYFGSQSWAFSNSLMLGFTAEYESGDIKVDGVEIVDAGWFTPPDLPVLPGKISIARRLIDDFLARRARS
jgi:NAD+ diphosphatase